MLPLLASIFEAAIASRSSRSSLAVTVSVCGGGAEAEAALSGCSSSRCTARPTSPPAVCSAIVAWSSVKPIEVSARIAIFCMCQKCHEMRAKSPIRVNTRQAFRIHGSIRGNLLLL
jgi:hypothetical protein